MQQSRIDYRKVRNALKTKRNSLFADFSKTPSNTRLALQIRLLDDRIADLDCGLNMKVPQDPLNPKIVQ